MNAPSAARSATRPTVSVRSAVHSARRPIAAALLVLAGGGMHAAPLLAARSTPRPSGRALDACPTSRADAKLDGRTAAEWIDRAIAAVGMPSRGQKVLHYRVSIARELADQSDRSYPPFIQLFRQEEHWFDPATGVERGPGANGQGEFISGRGASFDVTRGTLVAAPRANPGLMAARAFDPWSVLLTWKQDTAVRIVGECPYLDFDRVVLARPGALGEERLYLDESSAFPLKLETTELHYFLGPVHARYLYSGWDNIAPFSYYPVSVIKVTDGLGQETHTVFPLSRGGLVARDSAPSLQLPGDAVAMPRIPAPPFGSDPTDTVRIGPHAFLLANRAFTSVIALAADTVYLFDAPAGEERAQQDSAWIPRLFPGRHPVELVLFNTMWPHIAGLRFWVASGARVTGSRLVSTLVRRAVNRRWREHPDRLERMRVDGRAPALRFSAVTDARTLGGGAVRLYELHGAASEGALMAYLPHDRFLWASDRIQDVSRPSLYVAELIADVQRDGLAPEWTSGPHFHLVPWKDVARWAEPSGALSGR